MRDDIRRGMETHLETLRATEAAGDARVGWKIGFNDPAIQEKMGLDATLVGHLARSRVLLCGATYAVAPGAQCRIEVEIALDIAHDVPAGADLETARGAIFRLLPALEIVDFSRSFENVETILGHDIFHEAVVFAPEGSGREGADLDGVTATAVLNGDPPLGGNLELVPADLGEVVRHVADTLGALGETLRAGERIIAGSLVPPVPAVPGDVLAADLGPLGRVDVRIAAG